MLLENVLANSGPTHFVRYRHLVEIKGILESKLGDQDSERVIKPAATAVDSLLTLVDKLHEAYMSLTRNGANYTHSWLFTEAGERTFRNTVERQDRDSQLKEILFDGLVLRLFSPRIYAVRETDDDEDASWKPDVRQERHTFCQSLSDHSNVRCRLASTDRAFTFPTTTVPGDACTVKDITEYFPYYTFATVRVKEEQFVNRNYSYRVDRIVSLPVSDGVKMFTLLFLSMLQNPITTKMLVAQNVYLNTAFLLFRTVRQRTCSVAMARSGANHRYLFAGNGKLNAVETNASSYKTDMRMELAYVDTSPMDNTRVQHYVAGLGYAGGMGCTIVDPRVDLQRQGGGDYVAVPVPASYDPESEDKMFVNGRASTADGNSKQALSSLDEVTGLFTTNPYATIGGSEAHVTLGCRHPLWMSADGPEHSGVHSMYLESRNPAEQYKSGFDEFFRPIATHHMHVESNVAVQGRQYHECCQAEPSAFKTVNKGFYGPNEHSSSAFRNLLDVSSVRTDQGMIIVDPYSCLATGRGTDDQFIKTGMRKRYAA